MTISASNGGRGTPPVPPEGHGPEPEPTQQVVVTREIVERSLGTTAERTGDSGLAVSFIVPNETSQLVRRTFLVEEQGKQNIADAITGGVVLANAGDIPKSPPGS